jgi:hypothetical protein
LSPCLKIRAITFLVRAIRNSEIPLTGSLFLFRNGATSEETPVSVDKQHTTVGRFLTEAELEASLPSDNYEARELKINQLLLDRVVRFFNTCMVQFASTSLEISDLKRNLEEGV